MTETKRRRGRPRSAQLDYMRRMYPELSARQSLYNEWHVAFALVPAQKLGLVNNYARDAKTNKRMKTKLGIVGQMFGKEFLASDEGKVWLLDHWQALVDLSVEQIKGWSKEK